MNRFIQNLLSYLLPFFPFLACISYFLTHSDYLFSEFLAASLLAIALYISPKSRKLPPYLICLIIFTIYHLFSTYLNDLIPRGSNPVTFMLFDSNVLACVLFFIVENTNFEDWFIKRTNRFLFFVVVIALVVSIIQIKNVAFFISPAVITREDGIYFLESGRNYSIYSWLSLNSIGVTFPILISVLLNAYENEKIKFFAIISSAIIVSFLTKTRYVMISAIIVLSQMLFSSKFTLKKKMTYLTVTIISIALLVGISGSLGVDLQKIIDERILEKGTALKDSESSAGARITSYKVFLIKFPEHPWLGVGPSTREDVLTLLGGIPIIHVGYLCYLYYYGIAGCLFFFLCLFFLLRDAWLVGKRHNFWGSFYGILAFCLANWTFVYFDLSESGIIIAAIYMRFYKYQNADKLEEDELASLAIS